VYEKKFIERSKLIHGQSYSYEKVNYVNSSLSVVVTCHVHGDWNITPSNHLMRKGCARCGASRAAKERSLDAKERFCGEASSLHGNKYDYSKFEWINARTKGVIICPDHGEFRQSSNSHLRPSGCPKCGDLERADSLVDRCRASFVEESRSIHGAFYDYRKVNYKGAKIPVAIGCPRHGSFFQTPSDHKSGYGCMGCGVDKVREFNRKDTPEDFLRKSRDRHGDKYDYSSVNYVDAKTRVSIKCRIHGMFSQLPSQHIKVTHGCDRCADKVRAQSKRDKGKDRFFLNAPRIHAKKYSYILSDYIDSDAKITESSWLNLLLICRGEVVQVALLQRAK